MTKICFCGIAGSGMSALAQIMKLNGFDVVGTDRNFDIGEAQDMKASLENLGIEILPQDGSAITDDIKTLYISTAITASIPDIIKAKEKNIEIKTRPELLAETFHQYEKNIAIGGTSGKTTTTAMVGYMLNILGKEPMMINGGILKNYEEGNCTKENICTLPNIIYNKKDICVIEADESNGTIENYNPYITLINNISVDHKPLEEIKAIFDRVSKKPSFGLVINKDCPNSTDIKNDKIKTVYFSTKDKTADFFASNIKNLPNGVEYELDGRKFSLKLIGDFNIQNALAAISIATLLGIDKFEAAKALEGFLGTKRRLEVIGVKNNITVINDFAHNPEKVLASVSALRSYEGRLIIMFQSHGIDPAKLYGANIVDSFAKCLNKEDLLLMPEIFALDKSIYKDISSKNFAEKAKKLGLNAEFTDTKAKAKEIIIKNMKPNDRIIIMGARDTSLENLCKEILKEI